MNEPIPHFQQISLEIESKVTKYMSRYGESSCQNSFVSSFLRRGKYDDYFAESGGFLLTYRKGISTEDRCVCLFPCGDRTDRDGLRRSLEQLLAFAGSSGRKLCFDALTSSAAGVLSELYPDRFRIQRNRNCDEYIYSVDALASLSGRKYHTRRTGIHQFRQLYAGRAKIIPLCPDLIPEIVKFQSNWENDTYLRTGDETLKLENLAVAEALTHFGRLNLSGICVQVDGMLRGYLIGSPLSPTVYDGIFCKGDRQIRHIYEVLFHESARMLKGRFPYYNWEEDIGIEGLRQQKLSYYPAYRIEKYLAAER